MPVASFSGIGRERRLNMGLIPVFEEDRHRDRPGAFFAIARNSDLILKISSMAFMGLGEKFYLIMNL